ncbi:MAG TPA: PD-(D/E)XK nuclease family protein, partial [bacterium]|nr:PD-(D/E)XK nuclease family protein [bacterium]
AEQLQWNPGDPEILYLFQQLLVELESSLRLHRRELTGFLQQALSLIEVEKGRGSGVKITGVQETAGLQKRLCIIGGATEEALPQSVRRMDIFLPDRLKAELNLDTYQRRLARERLDLYRLLHENENVYFSYPATHQGKPQMRSILLNSFQHEIWPRPVFKSAVGKVFTDDFSWEKVLGALSDGRKLKISVNGLEKLLQCPYRFFLEKIAGLTPYQIPAVEEIPTFWGHLVHTALEELGRQQCQQEITESTIQGWTEFFENRVRQLLAVAYQEEHRCCGLIKEILEQRLPEVTARVRKILSAHVGRVVVAVEQDFQVETASWCLRGKVDRIEKNSRETILEIIDFKTGVTPPPSYTEYDFTTNHHLQIPLYVWAMEKLTGKKYSAAIWHLTYQEESGDPEKKYQRERKLGYLNGVETYLEQLADSLRQGKLLPGADNHQECLRCPFFPYCRHAC